MQCEGNAKYCLDCSNVLKMYIYFLIYKPFYKCMILNVGFIFNKVSFLLNSTVSRSYLEPEHILSSRESTQSPHDFDGSGIFEN